MFGIKTDMEYIGRLFTVIVFVLLSVAGFGFSIYLFLVAKTVFLYVIAIAFLFLSILSGFFNILASYWYYKSFNYEKYVKEIEKGLKPIKNYPTVSVVMPTHDEEPNMIRKNVAELKKLNYQKGKLKIYVLNDSSVLETKNKIEKICKELRVNFIYRSTNEHYKAGALNNFLKHSTDEFIAIFDADENLKGRNFLLDTIPFFQDKKIAYVQTEKRYAKGTFFSDTVDIFDAFFFKFIETSRAMDRTAIFSGSCGVIRRSVLDEVGGFPTYMIEDTFFSLESDLKGYRGFYLPKVYAYGKPIDSFSKLAKQQWRYNYGDTQFVSYFLKQKELKKKSLFAKVNYGAHGFGLNYLSVVLILFTIISTAIVFSSLPFVHIGLTTFSLTHLTALEIAELLGLFAFLLSMFAPAVLTKIYFGSFKKGVMVFLLNYALAITRTKAALAVLFEGKNIKWTTTASTTEKVAKVKPEKGVMYALKKTKVEVAFVAILVILGIIALFKLNVAGGIWLLWYGFMYSLTTIFFYKYG